MLDSHMQLFKYCDKNGVNILRHKALKISHVDDFNDPFEFRLAKCNDNNINYAVSELYEFQRKMYRVVCFSAAYNNLIMWSHYSKNHTGILIGFETDEIIVDGERKLSDFIDNVDYEDEMIDIPSDFMTLTPEEREKIVSKNTYRKYTDWKYEDEYRALVSFDHAENKRYLDIAPKAIFEVVLGWHSDLNTELTLKDILRRDEYYHVKLKRAFVDDRRYQMRYEEVPL